MHCDFNRASRRPKSVTAASRRRCNLQQCAASVSARQVSKPPPRAVGLQKSHVTYTTNKSDIDVQQLHALLGLASEVHCGSSSPLADQLFAHWDDPFCDDTLTRLQSGIDCSVAVAAAYTSKHWLGLGEDGSTPGSRGWEWPSPGSNRQLVGFARASSDRALVATVHDVVVHPAAEGRGIARRLVAALVRAVRLQGISDIGCCTPASRAAFFKACSFDLDREGALPMVLTQRAADALLGMPPAEQAAGRPPLQDNSQLQRTLLEALDQRQAPAGRRVGFRW